MSRKLNDALRALVVSANSLRYNPEIDPAEAAAYEGQVLQIKATLEAHPDLLGGDGDA